MSNLENLPADGLLRARQIVGNRKKNIPGIIPVNMSTWYAGVADGRFPKPVRLGPNSVAWRASDIRRLVEHGIDGWKQVA
ncbi:MAG: AlpA family transcriptional regulator [Luteimonas sp.]|nr:AlpA family transcriptional regulator [Luteimonas sp.]